MSPAEKSSTTDNFAISSATTKDIDDLEEVVNLAYRGGKSSVGWKNEHDLVKGPRIVKDDLEKYLSDANAEIILLRDTNGVLAGTVHVERHGNDAHIGMLSVHPEYQNLGLGKRLLLLGENLAREKFSCTVAKMFVFAGRNELLGWYRSIGYEETGETMPFFGPESGLTPLVANAHFVVVAKPL
jgi:ribosomal protein S18 acetylase RimI-like enzyme